MFYQFLKLTLNVKILWLKKISVKKQLFTTLNFTFKYDEYLLYYENTDYFRISMRRKKFRATPGTTPKIRVNQS